MVHGPVNKEGNLRNTLVTQKDVHDHLKLLLMIEENFPLDINCEQFPDTSNCVKQSWVKYSLAINLQDLAKTKQFLTVKISVKFFKPKIHKFIESREENGDENDYSQSPASCLQA